MLRARVRARRRGSEPAADGRKGGAVLACRPSTDRDVAMPGSRVKRIKGIVVFLYECHFFLIFSLAFNPSKLNGVRE
jgi:hypothetical protein